MDQITRQRRSESAWREIVARQEQSGLTVTAFSEREGVYMNHAGVAQVLKRACRPPLDARTEGQLFFDLGNRRGLFNAAAIRIELASEITALANIG